MAEFTVYPDAIDNNSSLPKSTDNVTPVDAEVVNRLRGAILAVEAELGIQPSGTFTTVRARLDNLTLKGGGSGAGNVAVQNSGVTAVPSASILNFIGTGVLVTPSGSTAIIDIPGTSPSTVQETIAVTSNGQTGLTLSATPSDDTTVQMFVRGSKQEHVVDYTVTARAVTFNEVDFSLIIGDVAEFWYIVSGVPAVQETLPVTSNGQTTFILSSLPSTDGVVMMYVNGDKQQLTIDYTVSGTNVTWTDSSFTLIIGDVVEFWYFT